DSAARELVATIRGGGTGVGGRAVWCRHGRITRGDAYGSEGGTAWAVQQGDAAIHIGDAYGKSRNAIQGSAEDVIIGDVYGSDTTANVYGSLFSSVAGDCHAGTMGNGAIVSYSLGAAYRHGSNRSAIINPFCAYITDGDPGAVVTGDVRYCAIPGPGVDANVINGFANQNKTREQSGLLAMMAALSSGSVSGFSLSRVTHGHA
ncbi:MAG: hypothetical protein AAFN70_13400, partial [Planctomycetota bacterium]